jgi:peptidyl-prolyl cis-trans isomerase-like protein 2
LAELEQEYKAPEESVAVKIVADSINAVIWSYPRVFFLNPFYEFLFFSLLHVQKIHQAHYSTGAVAAGFTSTVMAPETKHEPAILDESIVRYQRIKKKG